MTNAIEPQGVEAQGPQAADAQSRTGLPNNSYLTLITSFRAFDRLREEWSGLETRCAQPPTVFQSYDWCRKWSDVYAAPDSQNEIFIIAGYRQNKLVVVWPLVRRSHRGLVILTWMTQPIGQYGDLLCDANIDSAGWLSAATKFIRSAKAADCMHLRHVREKRIDGRRVRAPLAGRPCTMKTKDRSQDQRDRQAEPATRCWRCQHP